MRAEIGLPPPERRIGLAAHDFAEAFAAPRVIVTRAEKRGGAPTVASRWLQRLLALVGEDAATADAGRAATPTSTLARDIDAVGRQTRRRRRGRRRRRRSRARPRSLSITEIETLVRDPYAIYAKHVLGLEPLDPLGLAPDYALRGTLIHDALGTLHAANGRGPFDAAARGAPPRDRRRGARARSPTSPTSMPSGRIRFAAIARWFVDWEARARRARSPSATPRSTGELRAAAPAGDRSRSAAAPTASTSATTAGSRSSTSRPARRPRRGRCCVGFAPQLALEAAMARGRRLRRDSPAGAVARPRLARRSARSGAASRSAPPSRRDWTADQVADEALAPLHGADRRLRRAGHALSSRAPGRCSRRATRAPTTTSPASANGRWSRARRTRCGSARRASADRRRDAEGAGRRLEPARLGLGVGQCRLGQDLRARRSASSACCSPAPIPARILCLTFTKAAAAEMAKRVFDDPRRMDDAARRRSSPQRSQEIEGRRARRGDARRARRLFARALETPGGLKIQTIHAFCERLLHQFPFEANVAGHFEVLDERDAEALRPMRAARNIAGARRRDARRPARQGAAASSSARPATSWYERAIAGVHRRARPAPRAGSSQYGSLDDALADLRARSASTAARTSSALRARDPRRMRRSTRRSRRAARAAAGRAAARTTRRPPSGWRRIVERRDDERPDRRLSRLLHQARDGELRVANTLVTKAVKNDWPGLDEMLEAERDRLDALLERLRAAECFEPTAAMLRLADAAIAEYERAEDGARRARFRGPRRQDRGAARRAPTPRAGSTTSSTAASTTSSSTRRRTPARASGR